MTRPAVTVSSLYTTGQCVFSVVGSAGVILLFAGIPQLIYSPTVSTANLLTFLLGAVLITAMVAGNAVLNYKYRQLMRSRNQGGSNGSTSTVNTISDIEDKPPSYDTILRLDGAPPDYYSLQCEKPPRYEDLGSFFSMPHVETSATTCDDLPQVHHFEATNPALASSTCLESTATSSCLASPTTATCYVNVASRRSSSNEEDELFPCGGGGGDDELVRGPELLIETSSLARSSFRRVSSVISTSESEKLYVDVSSPPISHTSSSSAPHLTDKILFPSETESSS